LYEILSLRTESNASYSTCLTGTMMSYFGRFFVLFFVVGRYRYINYTVACS